MLRKLAGLPAALAWRHSDTCTNIASAVFVVIGEPLLPPLHFIFAIDQHIRNWGAVAGVRNACTLTCEVARRSHFFTEMYMSQFAERYLHTAADLKSCSESAEICAQGPVTVESL